MSYQFYRTSGQIGLYGVIRPSPYTVDGEPGELPPDTIEAYLVYEPYPTDMTVTQKAVPQNTLDGSVYTFGWLVEEMTPEEIQASIPTITPRQMRLWLNNQPTWKTAIKAFLNSLPAGQQKDDAIDQWEYATAILRNNELVEVVRTQVLHLTVEEMNQAFREAALIL